jgi:hypothetical protein
MFYCRYLTSNVQHYMHIDKQEIGWPLWLTEWMLSGYTKYTTHNLVSRVLGNCSLQVVSCGPLQALSDAFSFVVCICLIWLCNCTQYHWNLYGRRTQRANSTYVNTSCCICLCILLNLIILCVHRLQTSFQGKNWILEHTNRQIQHT